MITSVHGASGDMWIGDKVGVLRPVVYAVMGGNDKCIGDPFKHNGEWRMVMASEPNRAIDIAVRLHKGQTDKALLFLMGN